MREGRFGDAREVTLRCGAATENGSCSRLRPRGIEVAEDVVLVGENEVKRGRTARFHEVVGGRRFTISATSFFQARPDGAEALVAAVRDAFVDDDELGTFIDAYCGVGLFAGLLGGDRKVVGIERNGPAVRDAARQPRIVGADRAGRGRGLEPAARSGRRRRPVSSRPRRQGRGAASLRPERPAWCS